ncbi:PepSY domain-containing protein [Rhizobium sp. L1K21]|uniref:PepSY domain-containing protein n=1 Tax=Rhizobium sp. L1K21 TaxID=2954933 RepID=UPI0020929B1E|nr:PepSY domain-containing protein [Rhizobium sp. L1K21]MCO6187048.1 PepSY domain-containing protein [Rhizobium sp. L1K21]
MKTGFLSTLLLAFVTATTAQAWDDDCDVPISKWQPRSAVLALAETQGWRLKRIKIDDGCYEVYGRDETGQSFEAKIDPKTLQIIAIRRGHPHR